MAHAPSAASARPFVGRRRHDDDRQLARVGAALQHARAVSSPAALLQVRIEHDRVIFAGSRGLQRFEVGGDAFDAAIVGLQYFAQPPRCRRHPPSPIRDARPATAQWFADRASAAARRRAARRRPAPGRTISGRHARRRSRARSPVRARCRPMDESDACVNRSKMRAPKSDEMPGPSSSIMTTTCPAWWISETRTRPLVGRDADRVGQEIGEHLHKSVVIALDDQRPGGRPRVRSGSRVRPRGHARPRSRPRAVPTRSNGARSNRMRAGSDPVEIEQVVDQADQSARIILGDLDQSLCGLRQIGRQAVPQQAERADHRGERRPQLVTDGGEEFVP